MKLFCILLLIAFCSTPTKADPPFCAVCSIFVGIPQTWPDLQQKLIDRCDSVLLSIAVYPCQMLIRNADLTDSYPKMLPFLYDLRMLGCKKFCW
ncbi:hypothetical protein CAEBREN_17057 [Caenorhabditis brenneri]|uniref:Saposin B-type domain-containing protein n=1 Tax=Caenorhabditis brenneri TaxID=135651 RepID=G0MFS3_CAEBE|nr:hypothetical protein CAEBREN_17057 [Caenorhabditis brenneri]